jgi:integrase
VEAAKAANEGRLTINKLWDQYCETNPDNKILKHEQRKFDVHIRGAIGDKEPAGLLPMDIDRIRLGLQKKGFRTTSARILELIRRTINYGIKKGLIPPIGFKIEIPRLNNIKTEDLSSDQLAKLIAALDTDEDQVAADILRLALFSGMRRGEIFKLQRGDLDFERRFILLRDPKSGRDEKIPMNETVLDIFKKILDRHNDDFLFPGKFKGTHITACPREFIKRIKKAAGLPNDFRPMHGLRHTYASMLASSGQVDLYTLQKLLTHKSPSMTIRYSHLHDDALRKAADVAGDIIAKASVESANGNNVKLVDQKK